jgi:hypothetical protein
MLHTDAEQDISTTLRASHIREGQVRIWRMSWSRHACQISCSLSEKPQQHYSTCQNKLFMGSVTHQFNKYTAKLQNVAHKSMYLETDHPRLLCKPLENSGKSRWQP